MMTTEDYFLPFKGKHDLSISVPSNGRYNNLNLNRNHQCFSVASVRSNDFSKKTEKLQSYEITYDTPKSKSSLSWKKSENKLPSEYLNIHSGSDKNKSKEGKDSSKNKNSSTLSLHIAAYEDSIETASDSFEAINSGKDKSSFVKNLKYSSTLSSAIINPFEFPRQQTDNSTDPAVMQFTASQQLLNLNQGTSAMRFRGIRGINKRLEKNSILIYHGTNRSFIFQFKDNKVICVQCQDYHNRIDKSFQNPTYSVTSDEFSENPGVTANHRCSARSRMEVEAEQEYRKVLRKVSGQSFDGPSCYKQLQKRFKKHFGNTYHEALDLLGEHVVIQKVLRKRSVDGQVFDDNSEDDDPDVLLTDEEDRNENNEIQAASGMNETREKDMANVYNLRSRKRGPPSS